MNKRVVVAALGVLFASVLDSRGDSIPLGSWGFSNITHNSAANAASGEDQLTVKLLGRHGDPSRVAFLFKNAGPERSSIADVYFDDGTDRSLLEITKIVGSAGVSFSEGASPRNLPGANNAAPKFQVTPGLSADSDAPVQPNGVNPGEWLRIVFKLQDGKTSASVLEDLLSRDLRIGIHVQGFANGGSESFVNGSLLPRPLGVDALGAEVPSPSALSALIGLGITAGFFGLRRRKGMPCGQ